MQTDIKKNINNVLNSINSSCQQANINANKVSLIAVSKRKSIENIQNAMDIGIKNFGENYAQELNEKNKLLNSDIISWHFIGPLQSNKVKLIADSASWIHTLDREKIIVKLNEACNTFNKTINGLIQINISNENTKNGCNPDQMLYLADLVESASNINLRGIMALPDINANASDRETEMREIIDLSKKLQKKYPHACEISMGTTNDFEEAIVYGSTMVRIGELIFGKRT